MPTPIPSAATSGIQECPGSKPAGTSPWPASRSTSALASGRPASRPSALADQRDEQRLGGDQAADLARRRAERAQHRGLPAALGDHERERAGDHEQRDEAGDAAHRAEDRDERLTVARLRVAGVGVGRVGAVEHLEARPAQPGELRAGLGDDADRVDPAGRAGERVRGRGREEQRGLAAVVVGGAAGDAGDAIGALAARRGEVERGAEPCGRRESTTTSRGAGRRVAGGRGGTASARRWPSHGPAVRSAPSACRSPAPTGTTRRRWRAATPGAFAARATASAGRRGAGMTSTCSGSLLPTVTEGSARTTASAAARRPGPGALSAPAMSRPVP